MLVRAGDGDWQQLRPVGELPSGGFRALCGADAANLLELDTALPIVAFRPNLDREDARIDAIGLSADGGITLLLATFHEQPQDTLWRIMHAAGALHGSTPDQLAQRCTELDGEGSLGAWLARRVGGDAGRLEARLAETLDAGSFDVFLVGGQQGSDLAAPLGYLQVGPATVRAFELELLGAGAVQAIEGFEVPYDGSAPRASAVASAPAAPARPPLTVVERTSEPEPEQWAPREEPEAAAEPEFEPEFAAETEFVAEAEVEPEPEPQPEPEQEAAFDFETHARETEPEQEEDEEVGPTGYVQPTWLEPAATAAAPEAEPEVEATAAPAPDPDAPLGDPSSEEAFLAAVDKLDHKSSAHLRYLHDRVVAVCDEVTFTCEGDVEYMVGWHGEGETARPLLGVDSIGGLQIVLSALPVDEQEEFAHEVAGLLREQTGAELMEAGVAHLDVPRDLNDQTLLEYVMDNLFEAMPGGREAFGTTRGGVEPEEVEPEAAADEQADEPEVFEPEADEPEAEAPVEVAAAEPAAEEDDFEFEDDFFAGVSASTDEDEVRSAITPKADVTPEPEAEVAPEPEAARPEPTPAPAPEAKKQGGFSRRFRRRDAA